MTAALVQIQTLWLLPFIVGQLPPVPKAGDRGKAAPELVVTQRKIELGTVLEGDKVKLSWLLENRGRADLIIQKVKPA